MPVVWKQGADALESIVQAAARLEWAAHATDDDVVPPAPAAPLPAPGTRAEALAIRLGLTLDELDFVWAAVARAVDPRAGAHLRGVFPALGRGLSVAEYAALRELPAHRTRELLRALDERRPLVRFGLVSATTAIDTDGVDVDVRWIVPARAWTYLCGADELDPRVALVATSDAPVDPDLQPLLAGPARDDGDAGWEPIADAPLAIIVDDASGSIAIAAAAAPRATVQLDCAAIAPADAPAAIGALAREALLGDALPVLARFDLLCARLDDAARVAVVRAVARIDGPLAITTAPRAKLPALGRTVLRTPSSPSPFAPPATSVTHAARLAPARPPQSAIQRERRRARARKADAARCRGLGAGTRDRA